MTQHQLLTVRNTVDARADMAQIRLKCMACNLTALIEVSPASSGYDLAQAAAKAHDTVLPQPGVAR